MKNPVFLILFLFLCHFRTTAQEILVQEIPAENKPWSSLDLNNDPGKFHFAVVPDRTGGHRPGVFPFGVTKLNLLQPEFVVSVGDLIEGYTEDTAELTRQWEEFNGFIAQLGMPFFYVAGNHDYTNPLMAELWKNQFGADYYYFVYRNVLFLCLNSEDGATALTNPDFSAEQAAFVEQTLAGHPDVRWTMVFMHQPLWLRPTAKNWQKVESLLAGRNHSVFTGHLHQYALHNRNNTDYFVLATMGGGSRLRGKKQGEFDHFLWVTMTDDGPYYANILIDGVEDKSVQTTEDLARRTAFNSDPPVRIEPFFYSGELPGELTTKVVFNNNTPEPHQYRLTFEENATLIPDSTQLELTLEPGDRIEIPLRVRVADPANLAPLRVHLSLEADTYAWTSRTHFLPNEKYRIGKPVGPVTIDGDLSEWDDLRFAKKDEAGRELFRFDVVENGGFLYVGIEVADDDIQTGFGHSPLSQDGAFFLFDARPLAQSAYNLRHHDGIVRGEWLFVAANPQAAEFDLSFQEMMPPGLTGKGKITDGGYAVEYAIPVTLLQKFQGGDWQYLRLNVSVLDKDGDAKEVIQQNWLPDWTENYPGSGTFFRGKKGGQSNR